MVLTKEDIQTLSICELTEKSVFWFRGKQWSIGLDKLGFLLYRNGNLYRRYAERANVCDDIKQDILAG
jgi:hypothetical protein